MSYILMDLYVYTVYIMHTQNKTAVILQVHCECASFSNGFKVLDTIRMFSVKPYCYVCKLLCELP